MEKKFICTQCNREQPGSEMQCECGNIDPLQFEEKDIYHEPVNNSVDNSTETVENIDDNSPVDKPVDNSEQGAPKTMVEKSPHIELKSKVDKDSGPVSGKADEPFNIFSKAKKKKKKKK